MDLLPVFQDVKGRPALVVGGGTAAARTIFARGGQDAFSHRTARDACGDPPPPPPRSKSRLGTTVGICL